MAHASLSVGRLHQRFCGHFGANYAACQYSYHTSIPKIAYALSPYRRPCSDGRYFTIYSTGPLADKPFAQQVFDIPCLRKAPGLPSASLQFITDNSNARGTCSCIILVQSTRPPAPTRSQVECKVRYRIYLSSAYVECAQP